VGRHVVVVLHPHDHLVVRGAPGALADRLDAPAPRGVVGHARFAEAGEAADQPAPEVVREARRLGHVQDLHLAQGHVGTVVARAEVRVAGRRGELEAAVPDGAAERPSGVGRQVRHRRVGAPGHEHDARVAEPDRPVQDRLEAQAHPDRPDARMAHRVQRQSNRPCSLVRQRHLPVASA
jgi:hypothetical protein